MWDGNTAQNNVSSEQFDIVLESCDPMEQTDCFINTGMYVVDIPVQERLFSSW